jgi:hypothetical protein
MVCVYAMYRFNHRGVRLREYAYGGQAEAQRLRMIWSAAANGIPCDAAF